MQFEKHVDKSFDILLRIVQRSVHVSAFVACNLLLLLTLLDICAVIIVGICGVIHIYIYSDFDGYAYCCSKRDKESFSCVNKLLKSCNFKQIFDKFRSVNLDIRLNHLL